nr:hypothetical protein [Planobispora takensis]
MTACFELTVPAATAAVPHPAAPFSDGDGVVEVDLLYGVQQPDALGHRPLEGLASDDQAHAARPLVDHRGPHGLRQIILARGRASGIDRSDPAHEAVGDLPAGQVDRVVTGQLAVHQVAAVVADIVLAECLVAQVDPQQKSLSFVPSAKDIRRVHPPSRRSSMEVEHQSRT